ncbi:MAG: hypothetical protein M3157_01780 [Actinomycetota bacterium]|nr:hypothetical protein [Actinomycetota bacterium]
MDSHRNKETRKAAEYISSATRLPLIAVPLFFVVGAATAGLHGVLWALLCLLLSSGLSLLYLLYLMRTGRVRNPRRISQAERIGPLRVVAGLHAGGFLVVALLGAPAVLQATLFSYALSTVLFALIAPFKNLSLHTAGISGATVCLIYVFGPPGALAALLLPPVWWARSALGRHTPSELALGVLVGGGGTWVAFALVIP